MGGEMAGTYNPLVHDRNPGGFTPAQVALIREGLARRSAKEDPAGLRGLDRIEVEVIEGLEYRAWNPHESGRMRIGEPVARGGAGEGSSPLSHVLAGAAACLLNQFIRVAVADGLPLRFTRATSRAEFSRAVGGGFERITTVVNGQGSLGEGSAGDDAARTLVERAEQLCYIHVTLRRAVEMTTVLVLDGREHARSVTGPGRAGA
jgi:uncharacterized OsmC-like protein